MIDRKSFLEKWQPVFQRNRAELTVATEGDITDVVIRPASEEVWDQLQDSVLRNSAFKEDVRDLSGMSLVRRGMMDERTSYSAANTLN